LASKVEDADRGDRRECGRRAGDVRAHDRAGGQQQPDVDAALDEQDPGHIGGLLRPVDRGEERAEPDRGDDGQPDGCATGAAHVRVLVGRVPGDQHDAPGGERDPGVLQRARPLAGEEDPGQHRDGHGGGGDRRDDAHRADRERAVEGDQPAEPKGRAAHRPGGRPGIVAGVRASEHGDHHEDERHELRDQQHGEQRVAAALEATHEVGEPPRDGGGEGQDGGEQAVRRRAAADPRA